MLSAVAIAAPIPTQTRETLNHQLGDLHGKIEQIEREIAQASKLKANASAQNARIQTLLGLRRKQRLVTQKKLKDLTTVVNELESREQILKRRIRDQKQEVRAWLLEIHRSSVSASTARSVHEWEKEQAPLRLLLGRLVVRSLDRIEMLRNDVLDAETLSQQILEEKQHLAYYDQELKEEESLLEFHKTMQADALKQSASERAEQLLHYRNLKTTESRVSKLISELNERMEFEKKDGAKSQSGFKNGLKSAFKTGFAAFKGKLKFPLDQARVVSQYGRVLDPKSRLYVFKKGVDLDSTDQTVRAIYAGKVAYVGELPGYGNVTILDHGSKYYSILGKLAQTEKKVGDFVAVGEKIGSTDGNRTPLYVEIRQGNTPVNPLQWFEASSKI